MKILLTGATGFLGGHIADALLAEGYEVKAIYRNFPKNYEKTPWFSAIEWCKGELLDTHFLNKVVADCDAIIHAAARTDQYPSDLKSYYDINVTATEILIKMAQTRKLRLVFVSTANVFAPTENGGTETNAFCWENINSGYVTSKYLAQKAVEKACNEGLDAVIVNPTFMIGGFDMKPSSGAIIQHVLKEFLVFYPKTGGKNFIYVKDAAMGVVKALQKGKSGRAYLLANQNLDYLSFMQTVAKLANYKRIFVPLPTFLLITTGRIVSLVERIFPTKIPLNYANAVLLTTHNFYDAKRAIQELSLPQTPIEKAIKEAIDWFEGIEKTEEIFE